MTIPHTLDSVTITPTTRDPNAVLTVLFDSDIDLNEEGIQFKLYRRSVNAGWRVVAKDRQTRQSYQVLVYREFSPATVTWLTELQLSGLTLAPEFHSSTVAYTASAHVSLTETTVTAPPLDPNATDGDQS